MKQVTSELPGTIRASASVATPTAGSGVFSNEDWWSVWVGLLLVGLAWLAFASGGSIKWFAAAPAKWSTLSQAGADILVHLPNYGALLVVFAVLFGVSVRVMKQRLAHFLPAFLLLFIASLLIFEIAAWSQASHFNLEAPLVALLLGLVVANSVRLPAWLLAGLRVEFYIKVGIVLLGATLPFTLLVWAGPVAVGQATVVSLVTFFVIFLSARALGLERRFAAVLGVGGAVCGVSAAIAIAGAVRARREHASVAITLVVLWAIVMIFVLPFAAHALGLSTGVAGAWIGTSEFADAAGIAAAQAYGDIARHSAGAIAGAPDAAVQNFTLMKVVGRDIWIGIWAFALAWVATSRWDALEDGLKAKKVDAGEIWARFPKFVIGFVIASALITWISSSYSLPDYRKIVTPDLVAPITALRIWVFTFCFLSIGLTTRFGSLSRTGWKPLAAFTAGVAVNIVLGYIMSAHVFAAYWDSVGH